MKHLVLSVSPDSSLDLLKVFADVVILDSHQLLQLSSSYDTVYIRSHFGQPSTLPQHFETKINDLVHQVKQVNPAVRFIDSIETVDQIIAFEDKWHQYQTFDSFMPTTELYTSAHALTDFTRPVFKKRLSSRGVGVTWNQAKADPLTEEWLIQESMDIIEELRIYIIFGVVYPVATIKQSMKEGVSAQAKGTRQLTPSEIDFSFRIFDKAPTLDMIGIDVALTADGTVQLMEVNRSPGFAKFEDLTGINLASLLYKT